MKGKLVLVLSLFVLLSFWVHIVRIYPVEVKAVNGYPVHNIDTGLNYTTIQEAIDANETLEGHTILVNVGTYYEHLSVNKTVRLVGENKKNTIIDGNGTRRHIVTITADDVVFEQFTVRNGTDFLIFLDHTFNVTVANNIVEGNPASDGIRLDYSNSNKIIDNMITGHGSPDPYLPIGGGLYIQSSRSNIIQGNNITDNVSYGISLPSSPNNTIIQNIISSDIVGIEIFSSGCVIYHNVLNNIEYYIDSIAKWNDSYPSGGNYWTQYQGRDLYSGPFQNETGSDGIGDTPLDMKEMFPQSHIDSGNIDHFPLMGMFHDFIVEIGYQQFEHAHVISNSTVLDLEGVFHWLTSPNEYFQVGQPLIWLRVTGEEGGVGFCRIMIPRAVLNDSYVVLVWWEFQLGAWKLVKIPSTELPISNSTHAYLYFTYIHPLVMDEITITIPEFTFFLILPLFMMAILPLVFIHKRKSTQ